MVIYLTPNTVGRNGDPLKGNLRHLPSLIQDELNKAGFTASFGQLWLTLFYPPLYVHPGAASMVADFRAHYEKLPTSRLSRRYKTVDVSLPCPEFSEHFDLKEKDKYKHKFEAPAAYRGFTEAQLGKALVDKYLEAGTIITAKLKKGDFFDTDTYNRVLWHIRNEINDAFLAAIHGEQSEMSADAACDEANKDRENRKNNPRPADKPIRDLRVYYDGLPKKALYPYDYQYSEIFLNVLGHGGFCCPTYDHIYIQVAEEETEALRRAIAFEKWYANGIATIDYGQYKALDVLGRSNMVFEAIANGLRDIANIDGLDMDMLEEAIAQIKKTGLDTILLLKSVDHKHYRLTIKYLSRSMEEKCPVYGELTDKQSGKTSTFEIGKANQLQIRLWLQKVTVTNKQVKIQSSKSVRADVWLEGLPREMVFEIASITK